MVSDWVFGISDFSTSEPLLNAERIIGSGLNFIEPGLAKAAALSDEKFDQAAERLSDIHVQSMNWFLPPTLKVVGPEVDEEQGLAFLTHALARANRLGAKAVVFGSPGSRSIPAGFSTKTAEAQMVEFCRMAAEVISGNDFGMKIAVEHVNHTETNFLNTFAQAFEMVKKIDRPEIALAADFYHFEMEGESVELMKEAGDLICAVQLANPEGRSFPRLEADIPRVARFFECLSEIGYQGGISVEATVGDDLESDCRAAVEFFAKHHAELRNKKHA